MTTNVLKILLKEKNNTQQIAKYMNILDQIKDLYTIEDVQQYTHTTITSFLILKSIFIDICLKNKDYKSVYQSIDQELIQCFYGKERQHDLLVSYILNNIFCCICAEPNEDAILFDVNYLYSIFLTNKDRKNKFTKSVIVNIILYFNIKNQQFDESYQLIQQEIHGNIQLFRNAFFVGIIYLFESKYKEAKESFQRAEFLLPDQSLKLNIEKYKIISTLLYGKIGNLKSIKWTKPLIPYYELYKAIETGNLDLFEKIIEKRTLDFEKDGLMNIVRRLYHSVLREGIRRICTVYSRITIKDISKILKISESVVENQILNNQYSLHKNGKIVEREFINDMFVLKNSEIVDAINQALFLQKEIAGKMRFPERGPLNFDNIDKTSLFYDFD